MDKIIAFSIDGSTQNKVWGQLTTSDKNLISSAKVYLFYWREQSVWLETAPTECDYISTMHWADRRKGITYHRKWSINIPEARQPTRIYAICTDRSTEFGEPVVVKDEQFNGLPRYHQDQIHALPIRPSNIWSIASDRVWISNLMIDACAYPRRNDCYGCVQIDSECDPSKARLAIGKKTGNNRYKFIKEVPIETEQTHRRIWAWDIKMTPEMAEQLNFGYGEELVIIAYDVDRQLQIFNDAYLNTNGSYEIEKVFADKPNVCFAYICTEAEVEEPTIEEPVEMEADVDTSEQVEEVTQGVEQLNIDTSSQVDTSPPVDASMRIDTSQTRDPILANE